jgi:hypothetical protein
MPALAVLALAAVLAGPTTNAVIISDLLEITDAPLFAPTVLAKPVVIPPSPILEFRLPTYVGRMKIIVTDERGRTHYMFNRFSKVGIGRLCNGSIRDEDGTLSYMCQITTANPAWTYWIALYDARGKPVLVPGEGKAMLKCEAEARGKKRGWKCAEVALP